MTLAGRRYFSKPACNMKFAVASLLEKPGIHMKKTEKKMIIASLANNPMRMLKGRASTSSPAQSQQLPLHTWDRYKYCPPEIITLSTPPHTGKIRSIVRKKDGRVRMVLSRKGCKRLYSNFHESKKHAYRFVLNKLSKLGKHCAETACNPPARSQYAVDVPGVDIVHQIYGLYRDGKEMSTLFQLSSMSWRFYCSRQKCRYILWTADAIDTLIQKYAPQQIKTLYTEVRFLVQRVDIARFFVLYIYGGLYADLDILPNRMVYPQVAFGLCKMPSRSASKPQELEMEMVIATRGNDSCLKVLEYMIIAKYEKGAMKVYDKWPCRYIYQTTGPKMLARFIKKTRLQHSITFFPMSRPIEGLNRLVEVSESWRSGSEPILPEFDVLSAYSMSYKGQEAAGGANLSRPVAELPSFPETIQRRLTRKGPSSLNPWRRGKLEMNSEAAEAWSQQADTKLIPKTLVPACEHTDSSGDEAYLFLNSDSNDPITRSKEHWDMLPEDWRENKRRAGSAEGPNRRNVKERKIKKKGERFPTCEAINRLIRGYS